MKNKLKINYIIFLTIVFTFSFYFIQDIPISNAETAEELRDQINKTNQQIADLDKEIQKYQNQIAETAEQAKTLSNMIKELNITRSKLIKEREQIEKKIKATNLIILEISGDINEQIQTIDQSKKTISRLIKELNRNDQEMFLEKVLLKNNLTELSKDYNQIVSINEKLRQHIKELRQEKEELNKNKDQKEEENEKLTSLKNTLVQKEQAVLVSKKEKDKILAETKNQESNYKKLLEESKKKMEIFEQSIAEYEAKLELILNPKSILKPVNGILAWPLKSILITSPFGNRCILGSCRFHSGVDFRASVGTSVLAMADGVVEAIGDTDVACKGASLGKWVFIKHDNGLSSSYGHLSSILIKKGTKVKAGQVIALSGNTGYSTGPHLHVSIFASEGVKIDKVPSQSCKGAVFVQPMLTAQNARLDPLLYLPKTTPDMFKN